MIAVVSSADGEVRASVEDAGSLRQLHAEFRGVDDSAAAAALSAAGLGELSGDHVWLSVARLRAAADASPEGAAGFDGMIAYAAGKGWMSADGTQVQAHVVRA
jgi:hypothetical protein